MPKPTASSEGHLYTDFILEPAVKVSQHWLSEGDTDYYLLAEVHSSCIFLHSTGKDDHFTEAPLNYLQNARKNTI